jgi:hypothetical protein
MSTFGTHPGSDDSVRRELLMRLRRDRVIGAVDEEVPGDPLNRTFVPLVKTEKYVFESGPANDEMSQLTNETLPRWRNIQAK